MTYDTFNELLQVQSTSPVKTFEYQNITKSRLWINKFDLLPNIYFAKFGKVRITKNGITVYENNLNNNKLLKYSQFPIRAEIPFLDRDDEMKIYIHNYDDSEISESKLGISLELDFEDIPISSILIPFTIQQLSQISKKISLFDNSYMNKVSEKYYKEFDITGYSNLSFTILSRSAGSALIISEIHNAPPVDFLDKLQNGYWGNNSVLTKSGTVESKNGMSWDYEVNTDRITTGLPTGFGFYDESNNLFNPTNANGVYDSDITIFDTNNLLNVNKEFNFVLSSSSDFDIDVKFVYLSSIFYSTFFTADFRNGRHTTQHSRYEYSYVGKRIFSNNVNKITVEGSNSQDFSNPTLLFEKDNYDDSNLDINFSTTFRYLRFKKIITFSLIVEDCLEADSINWSLRKRDINGSLFDIPIEDPHVGLVEILNNLPVNGMEYLPNRVMGFFEVLFPDYVPENLRNFLLTVKQVENNPSLLQFSKHEAVDTSAKSIKIGLESKGSNDEWFEILNSIGRINTAGKTTQNINEFTSGLVLPKGQSQLRAVLQLLGNLKISADVVLSN